MVSSPTKIGEYLAAGLPVVSTAHIGDLDEMLAGGGNQRLGVIVTEDSEAAYEKAAHELIALMQTEGVRERCRVAARQLLDLETVGWPRYRRMYERLA
jgi:glycosyltransferase involved in cell wall biosynthesis